MTVEAEIAHWLVNLDDRVRRLETLEQSAGGGGGGDLFLIETVTLTAEGTISIANIPSTAKHLFYTGHVLSKNGTSLVLLVNASVATDLSSLSNMGCGGLSSGATTFASGVRMGVVQSAAGIGVPSNVFSSLWGWIPDIQTTTNETGTVASSGCFNRDDVIIHQLTQGRGGGSFNDGAVITQLDLLHDVGTDFEAGSTFSLYGLTA